MKEYLSDADVIAVKENNARAKLKPHLFTTTEIFEETRYYVLVDAKKTENKSLTNNTPIKPVISESETPTKQFFSYYLYTPDRAEPANQRTSKIYRSVNLYAKRFKSGVYLTRKEALDLLRIEFPGDDSINRRSRDSQVNSLRAKGYLVGLSEEEYLRGINGGDTPLIKTVFPD